MGAADRSIAFFEPPPDTVEQSQLTAFTRFVEREHGVRFPSYASLHDWSVRRYRDFWDACVRWLGLEVEGSREVVCTSDDVERAAFFPSLVLSYTSHLLGPRRPNGGAAVVGVGETGLRSVLHEDELREQTARLARFLANRGVGPGDRVAAWVRNTPESVVACLAVAGVGAAWSGAAPDLGEEAVLDRFARLAPRVLVVHGSFVHQGREQSLEPSIRVLRDRLPSVEHVIVLGERSIGPPACEVTAYSDALRQGDGASGTWARFPFDHPLFVLWSSGTTGAPKGIVHGAGGTLLEHLKEHRLHGDLGPDDVLYFHTSSGWMMWNWQLSALATGARIVLYDGSPTHPDPDRLWKIVEAERVTVLGTSPTYLQFCQDSAISPRERADLASLRAIQSTGSILHDRQYDWVASHVKRVPVQSISGGTDILGCFVLGNPNQPVLRGESQCLGLGLDVRALRTARTEGLEESVGELVCGTPFPSRPVGLLDDPDGARFHATYFAENAGFWTHGDFLAITPQGGARILGRSDGVLNVRGVRIGPAEIYRVLDGFEEVSAALALEQSDAASPGGSRLVLLVVLRPPAVLERPLVLAMKKALKTRASAVHVPAVIAAVSALPVTWSGKVSARAARDALERRTPANLDAIRNPETLREIAAHPELEAS